MNTSLFEQDRRAKDRIATYHREPQEWRQRQLAQGDRAAVLPIIMSAMRARFHALLQRLHLETRTTLESITPESAICQPGEAC